MMSQSQPKTEPVDLSYGLLMCSSSRDSSSGNDRDSGVESAGKLTDDGELMSSPEGTPTEATKFVVKCAEEDELEQYAKHRGKGQPTDRKGPAPSSSASALLCAVCGDAASCLHYGVSSCNGCKTFFRRTIISGRKFVCKRGGKCHFDRDGRCACRACRFQRCVKAGMDEKAIRHTPSANLTLSIARKRFQRLNGQIRWANKRIPSVDPVLLDGGFESEVLAIIGETLRMEEKLNRLRTSTFSPPPDQNISEAVELDSVFGDSDKYTVVRQWPCRPSPRDIPIDEQIRLGLVRFWKYVDMYLGMEQLKTMDFFREMGREEKVALTKSVIVPNSWLTSANYALNIRSEVVQYPDGFIPFQWRIDSQTELERKILRGAIPALRHLKPDQVQTALIRWILLLNETCDGLSSRSRERIGALRSKLTRVLLVYLQNKFGADAGIRHFADSLHFISTLFRLQQIQHSYFVYRSCVLQNVAPVKLFRDFLEF